MKERTITKKHAAQFLGISAVLGNIILGWFPVGSQALCFVLGVCAIVIAAVDFTAHPEDNRGHKTGIVLGSVGIIYATVSFFARALPIITRAGWV